MGDPVYGGTRRLAEKTFGPVAALANAFPRQALHAATLGFDHPVSGARMEFTSPLPPDLAELISGLRAAAGVTG